MSDARKREDKDDQAWWQSLTLCVMETPTHQRKSVVQLSYIIIMIYESVKAIWKIIDDTDKLEFISGISCFPSKGFQNFH